MIQHDSTYAWHASCAWPFRNLRQHRSHQYRGRNGKNSTENNFCLTLRFNEYPRNAFNLWLPELEV